MRKIHGAEPILDGILRLTKLFRVDPKVQLEKVDFEMKKKSFCKTSDYNVVDVLA